MKLTFRALEVPREGALYETNHLGWSTIETLVFNYDGKGTVLALKDGKLDEMGLEEFRDVVFGGWYELVSQPQVMGSFGELSPRQIEEASRGTKDLVALSKPELKMLYNLLTEKGHPDLVGYTEVRNLFYSRLSER